MDNKKINILLYSNKWLSGGIESFIMTLYKNIDREEFNVDILVSQDINSLYDDDIKAYGGTKFRTMDKIYQSPIKRTIHNFKAFYRFLKKHNDYDIIHLNIANSVDMIYGFLAKKAGIKKVIFHSHNSAIGKQNKALKEFAHNISKKLFERYGDAYFSCSTEATNWLYTEKNIKKGKVTTINNSIDARKFAYNEESRNEIRKELKIENELVIGNVGRFTEQKNHEFLIEIFEEIMKIHPRSILILIGGGENEEKIRKIVSQKDLNDKVIFIGETNQVANFLLAMDAFLLPSLFEGKPIVAVEAQAASLPIFMSDCITKEIRFIPELVFYMPLNQNPKEWAKQIVNNCNKERKNRYQEICQKGYDISTTIKQIEEQYKKLLKNEEQNGF